MHYKTDVTRLIHLAPNFFFFLENVDRGENFLSERIKAARKEKVKKVSVFLNRKRLTSEHRTRYHAQHARSMVEVITLAAI
jgi:hypothetical protein